LESFIFLGLILLVGAITQNKSIVYATIFVLILKILFNITESYKLKGIDIVFSCKVLRNLVKCN